MIFGHGRGLGRIGGLLACAALWAAGPALAQRGVRPAYPPPGSQATDAGADVRRNLTAVGTNGQSVSALIEAGRDALRLGDGQAALTFFSRAEELAPRDARVKAGMAAAMTHVGQPRAALGLFQEASALGAPEAELAAERGLARDLLGDPAGAQRDYASALRRRDDPELRRRMALSLAISGQREAALRMIEAQTRANDGAGWRTHAFVLALTGDMAGATRAAAGVAPAGTADAMAPFLARLPQLSPAQRAMAVHLGVFPPAGRIQYAGVAHPAADPGALALAGGGRAPVPPTAAPASRFADNSGLAPPVRRRSETRSPLERAALRRRADDDVEPEQRPGIQRRASRVPGPMGREALRVVSRGRPGAAPAVEREPLAQAPRGREVAAVAPSRRWQSEPAATAAPPPPEPEVEIEPVEQASVPAPTVSEAEESETLAPAVGDASATSLSAPSPSAFAPPPPLAGPAEPGFSFSPQAPSSAAPGSMASSNFMLSERPNSALGDIASVVNALPAELAAVPSVAAPAQPFRAPPPPAAAPVQPFRAPPPRLPEPAPRAAAPTPARHWVQLATGGDAGDFTRLRARASALSGRQAWSARTGAGNRLLTGPFASQREAQSFVNQLDAQGVSSVVWTSAAGQPIERLRIANDARPAPSRAEAARRPSGRAEGGSRRAGSRDADRRTPTTRAEPGRRTAAAGAGGRSRAEPRTPSRRSRTRD